MAGRLMGVQCRCDYCKEAIEDIGDGSEIPDGWIEIKVHSTKGHLVGRKHACPGCIEGFGGVLPVETQKDEAEAVSSRCVVIGPGAPGPEGSEQQTLFFGLNGKNLVTFDFSSLVPSITVAPMGGKHPIEDMIIALEQICAAFRKDGLDELLKDVSVNGIHLEFGSPEYMKALPFASVLVAAEKKAAED